MLTDTLDVSADRFAAATGWKIEPEGACKGEVCVPLGGDFELVEVADRLGMAVVGDEAHGVWAVGPETFGGRALVTAEAPDVVLEDLEGREVRLSEFRGRKLVLVAWAPY